MNAPQTSHAIVHLGIDAPDAQTLPVLLELDDPENPTISLSVAKFARYLQRQGSRSYESIKKSVIAIGKLRDFYMLERAGGVLKEGALRALLEDFLFAYDHGSALGWAPASNQSYLTTRAAVTEYVKFLADDSAQTWGMSELRFIEACRESWVSVAHAQKSLLFHTKKRSVKKAGGRKRQLTGLKQFKPFPPHLVQALLDHTKNPRDKLMFGLMAYGGRRLSELLHLFLEDMATRGEELVAFLKHPSRAPMVWVNNAGTQMKGSRREYLKTMFDRLPRNEHGANPSFAGWKGIKFDDEAALVSEMYWIREAGKYLLQLHRNYLYGARATVPKKRHPYYLVGEDGDPLTTKAAEKQFRLACGRLERKLGVSLKGYGPHSLRHFYGFYCADVLRTDLLLIQKWMGHVHASSTAVYAHLSPGTAAKALAQAELQAKAEGRIQLSEAERAKVAADFESSKMAPLPPVLELGSTHFGELDTKKLSRRIR